MDVIMRRVTVVAVLTAGLLTGGPALALDQMAEPTGMQRKAAKLAGLAGFVNLSCPEIQTETNRFRAAIEAMQVKPAELEQGALRLSAESYIVAYQKDIPASCRQANELFGKTGSVIPGLFVSR